MASAETQIATRSAGLLERGAVPYARGSPILPVTATPMPCGRLSSWMCAVRATATPSKRYLPLAREKGFAPEHAEQVELKRGGFCVDWRRCGSPALRRGFLPAPYIYSAEEAPARTAYYMPPSDVKFIDPPSVVARQALFGSRGA